MRGSEGGTTHESKHSVVQADGRKGTGDARRLGCPLSLAGRRAARGAALVWTALIVVVLMGIVGLSLDRGKVAWNLHQLHNAADAGALAGAGVVKCYLYHDADQDNARTRQAAIGAAFMNLADRRPVTVADNPTNVSEGEVVLGRWILPTGYFEETLLGPTAVKVTASRQGQRPDAPGLSTRLGRALGMWDRPAASRYAIAYCQDVDDGGDAIICLAGDPSTLPGWGHNKSTGLWLDGNATLDLRGPDGQIGDVQVNSTSQDKTWTAFRLQSSSAQIWVREFNVVGNTDPDASDLSKWASLSGGDLAFTVRSPAPSRLDPLRNVPAPDASNLDPGSDTNGTVYYTPGAKTFTTITGGTLTLKPGYYPGGINIGDSSRITLTGGPDAIYVFGGGDGKKGQSAGLVANAGSSIIGDGHGVLVYVSGDPDGTKWGTPCQYGQITIGGQAVLQLTSRYDAGDLPGKDGADGIALWQDRADTKYASIGGGAGSFVKGTLYCPSNALEVGGNTVQVAAQVIAGALWLHGTPQFLITYDGRNASKTYRAVLVQ